MIIKMKRGLFNNKKGQEEELPKWAIALIVLVIILIGIGILYSYGASAIDFIMNKFSGR